MIVKNTQQDIFIDLPDEVKNISLLMSGGTDSSILGYILCKYASENNKTFVPITNDRETKPAIDFARRIVDFYRERFPNLDIHEHIVMHTKKEDDDNRMTLIGGVLDKLLKDGVIDIVYTAKTENPPLDVVFTNNGQVLPRCKDRDVYSNRKELFEYADKPDNTYHESIKLHMPFLNTNKRGVCDLYKQFGLMETLFPLTRSCVSSLSNETLGFTIHCKECWWCHERNWGFGTFNNMYDTMQEQK